MKLPLPLHPPAEHLPKVVLLLPLIGIDHLKGKKVVTPLRQQLGTNYRPLYPSGANHRPQRPLGAYHRQLHL